MTKQSSSNFNPNNSENTFFVMSEIGLRSAAVMTDMWLSAMRGFIDAAGEKPVARAIAPQSETASVQPQKKVVVKQTSVEKADDLKKISGVGPKLEQVLNKKGIHSYAQIASMSDAEIVSVGESLGFPGRIERDDWVGQAKALMKI